MSTNEEIRQEMVRMRGFIRAAETQATKVLALQDELEEPAPTPEPEPTPEPSTPTRIFLEDWENGFGAWGDRNTPARHSIIDFEGRKVLRVEFSDDADAGWLARWFEAQGEVHVRTSFRPEVWDGANVKLTILAGNRSDDPHTADGWSSFGQAGVTPDGTDFFQSMVSMGTSAGPGREVHGVTYHKDQQSPWGDAEYDVPLEPVIGAWNQLDHYVKLNDPGEANGVVRVWLNGTQVYERTDLVLSTDPALALNMLMLSFNGSGLAGNMLLYGDVETWDGVLAVDTVPDPEPTPEPEPAPDHTGDAPTHIDEDFEGPLAAWSGTKGGGSISLIPDPTGLFGGTVALHDFSLHAGHHADRDIYRYFEGYSGSRTVHVAVDMVIRNVVVAEAQRKLIYLKGGRGYGDDGSWSSIVTLYGNQLYLAGDRGRYNNTYQIQPPSGPGRNFQHDHPYRIEFMVTTNEPGQSNGVLRLWLTDLVTKERNLIHDLWGFRVWDVSPDFPSADRIQVGGQLDNGGHEGSRVADERIFDRMMISSREIGMYGLS